ncbi:hypothetical protein M427DRAFT_55268 [Gonapodya prolifera JEL478]|uniref:Uncharacterized protein n=1 Tax=Gonapodya prolifera (strain JEL478) TaxID=1344416 RepID=A0A139AIH7_GONPJ|nr:hypothetical protein M427DRAFT_55268 [Gonapodya prolifera JEL478]|eukprot:KXS16612.1 hypothetical protein M427DRAFT_55268 [Gonapodya prolifera JEL478]
MTIDICEESWALPWNATSTKETEDWSAIDQALTIQGIGWIQRKVDGKPYGLTKAKIIRREGPGNVLVLETEAVSGVWKAVLEWSIEEEGGEQVHYRRVNFTSADKQIKVVQKFQRTPQ